MTANYFRSLLPGAGQQATTELSAKEEFRQLAAELNAKASEPTARR